MAHRKLFYDKQKKEYFDIDSCVFEEDLLNCYECSPCIIGPDPGCECKKYELIECYADYETKYRNRWIKQHQQDIKKRIKND